MEPLSLPIIDMSLCNSCGYCMLLCPKHAFSMIARKPVITHPELCVYCGECECICPEHAITLDYEIVLKCNVDNKS